MLAWLVQFEAEFCAQTCEEHQNENVYIICDL